MNIKSKYIIPAIALLASTAHAVWCLLAVCVAVASILVGGYYIARKCKFIKPVGPPVPYRGPETNDNDSGFPLPEGETNITAGRWVAQSLYFKQGVMYPGSAGGEQDNSGLRPVVYGLLPDGELWLVATLQNRSTMQTVSWSTIMPVDESGIPLMNWKYGEWPQSDTTALPALLEMATNVNGPWTLCIEWDMASSYTNVWIGDRVQPGTTFYRLRWK